MFSLFVSRHLDPDSPIIQFCKQQNISVHHESMLLFTPIPFRQLPQGDWLFFYSKSGVKFFLDQLADKHILADYKIACYGPSTAKRWCELSKLKVDFIGNGKPKDVPNDFRQVLRKEDIIVFVRAKHSKMSVQTEIEDDFNCLDIIAYQNNQRNDIDIQDNYDYAMLTSPMNADAFIKACPQFKGSIITLGTTTSEHLLAKYGLKSTPALEITESGMLESFKQVLN